MTARGDVHVRLTADGAVLERVGQQAERTIGNIGKAALDVERSTASLTSSLSRMGHAAAAAFSVQQLAQAADAWTNMNSRIRLSSASLAEAGQAMAGIYGIAQKTGVEMAGLADIYGKVARNAVQYGLSQKEALGVTNALANAVRLSGSSAAASSAAMLQFGQALSSGTLRGEELNSILEQTPALAEAIARGMGRTVGELRKLGEEGALTAQEVLGAIRKESARLETEVASMTPTIETAVTRLKNAFTKEIGEGGGTAARVLAGGIDALAQNLDKATQAALLLGGAFAAMKIPALLMMLGRINPATAAIGAGLVGLNVAINDWQAGTRTATDSIAKDMDALASHIGRVNNQIAAMSRSAAQAALDQARRARDVDANSLARLKQQYEQEFGGEKRQGSRDEIERRDALRVQIMQAESALARLDNEIKDLSGNLVNAGTKEAAAFLDKYATSADKAAAAAGKAAQEFKAAYDKASGNVVKQKELVAGFEAWLVEQEKKKVGTGGTAKAERAVLDSTTEAYKDYAKAIEDLVGIQTKAKASAEELTAAEAVRARLIESGAWGKLSDEAKDIVNAYVEQGNAAIRTADAEKTLREARRQTVAAAQREAQSLDEQVARMREENEAIGLTAEQLDALKLARLEAAIAAKEQALATLEVGDAAAAEVQAILHQIDALRELRGLAADSAVKRANVRAIEEQEKAWEKFADDIERSLTDSLYRSFEAGKDFGETFVDSLRNTIKAAVLKMAVQVVLQPITGQGGILQQGAQALGLAGQGSSAGSLLNTASSASSLYSASTGGGLYGSFATSSFGEALGLSNTAGAVMDGASVLTGMGSALPYIGAAMAVVSLLGGLGKQSTPHAGGIAFSSGDGYDTTHTVDAIVARLYNEQDAMWGDPAMRKVERSNFLESDWLKRFDQGIADTLGNTVSQFGKLFNAITRQYGAGSDYSVGAAFSADGDDPSRARFGVVKDGTIISGYRARLSDDATTGMQQFAQVIPEEILKGLREVDLDPVIDAWLDKSVSGATDALTALSQEQAAAILAVLESGWADEILAQLDVAGSGFDTLTAKLMEFSRVIGLKPVFDALELDIYRFGTGLADAFGGVEQAGAAMSAYYDQFYSDAEKSAATTRKVADAFSDLDLAMPATRDEFRDLVESLDLTTEAGRETFAALLNLAPAFGVVADAARGAAEAAIRSAQDAARTAAQGAGAAFDVLQAAIERAQQPLQERYDLAKAIAGSLQSAIVGLRGTMGQEAIAGARVRLDEMLVAARRGALPDQDELSRLLGIVQQDSTANYRSRADYLRAQLTQASELEELKGYADDAATLAEKQLDALQAQLEMAQAQLDALNGVNTSVLSVADAMAAFAASVEAAIAAQRAAQTTMLSNAGAVPSNSYGDLVTSAFQQILGRAPDQAGMDYWTQQLSSGAVSTSNFASAFVSGARPYEDDWEKALAYAIANNLTGYASGTPYVPRDMVARIHEGERIIPAADNRELMRRLNNDGNVIDITPLIERLDRLEAVMVSNTRHAAKTAKTLDRVVPDGDALSVRTAA